MYLKGNSKDKNFGTRYVFGLSIWFLGPNLKDQQCCRALSQVYEKLKRLVNSDV